jgi:hypothetical protein
LASCYYELGGHIRTNRPYHNRIVASIMLKRDHTAANTPKHQLSRSLTAIVYPHSESHIFIIAAT